MKFGNKKYERIGTWEETRLRSIQKRAAMGFAIETPHKLTTQKKKFSGLPTAMPPARWTHSLIGFILISIFIATSIDGCDAQRIEAICADPPLKYLPAMLYY